MTENSPAAFMTVAFNAHRHNTCDIRSRNAPLPFRCRHP